MKRKGALTSPRQEANYRRALSLYPLNFANFRANPSSMRQQTESRHHIAASTQQADSDFTYMSSNCAAGGCAAVLTSAHGSYLMLILVMMIVFVLVCLWRLSCCSHVIDMLDRAERIMINSIPHTGAADGSETCIGRE
jgi:hypothetical protein